jgi:hypothetical protein
MTSRFNLLVAVLVSGAVHSGLAMAQDTSAAEDVERGVKLMNQSDFAGALDAFSAAREKSPSAEAVARMAMAEQGLRRWADAEIHIEIALSQTEDPWIKKYRRFLEETSSAIAKHLGKLDVQGSPDGGVVVVDGEVIGMLPLRKPRLLTAGQHQLKVTAADHEPLARPVQIAAGQTAKIAVNLKSTSAPATPEPAPAPIVPPTVAQPEEAPPPRPAPAQHRMSTVGIVVMLSGCAALLAASAIAIHKQSDTIYKPIAIGGSAGQIVGFGIFLFDQTRGSAGPSTASATRASGFSLSWSF